MSIMFVCNAGGLWLRSAAKTENGHNRIGQSWLPAEADVGAFQQQ